MWQYIDSVSANGWGHLMKAFLPTSVWLLLLDLVLFVLVPVLMAWILIAWQRKHFTVGVKGAWRSAGAAWCVCFWLSLLLMVGVYYAASEALQFSRCGVTSFVTQYQQSLPGGENGIDGVVGAVRNADVDSDSSSAEEMDDSAPEYKVVEIFWFNYPYVHPVLFTLLDMILLGWFFIPGFVMKGQRIKL